MPFTPTLNQTVTLHAAGLDRDQNPIAIPNPVWAVSDPAIGTLAVQPDGVTAIFMPTAIGNCTVTCTSDTVVGSIDGTVSAPVPVLFSIVVTADAPVDR